MESARPSPQTLISFGLTGLIFGLMGTAYANASSKVSLTATIQDQPAFMAANWKVFDMNDHQNLVARLNGHSGTLDMQPGYYRAMVEFNNRYKETTFRVESGKSLHIQVALD